MYRGPGPYPQELRVKVGEGTSMGDFIEKLKEPRSPHGGVRTQLDVERCAEDERLSQCRTDLSALVPAFLPLGKEVLGVNTLPRIIKVVCAELRFEPMTNFKAWWFYFIFFFHSIGV